MVHDRCARRGCVPCPPVRVDPIAPCGRCGQDGLESRRARDGRRGRRGVRDAGCAVRGRWRRGRRGRRDAGCAVRGRWRRGRRGGRDECCAVRGRWRRGRRGGRDAGCGCHANRAGHRRPEWGVHCGCRHEEHLDRRTLDGVDVRHLLGDRHGRSVEVCGRNPAALLRRGPSMKTSNGSMRRRRGRAHRNGRFDARRHLAECDPQPLEGLLTRSDLGRPTTATALRQNDAPERIRGPGLARTPPWRDVPLPRHDGGQARKKASDNSTGFGHVATGVGQ